MVTLDKWNRLKAAMAEKTAALDPDAASALEGAMSIDFGEHFTFQNEQTRGHVEGVLSPEVAQEVYMALGEVGSSDNGGWAKGTDLVTKCLVTQLMSELMGRRLQRTA